MKLYFSIVLRGMNCVVLAVWKVHADSDFWAACGCPDPHRLGQMMKCKPSISSLTQKV